MRTKKAKKEQKTVLDVFISLGFDKVGEVGQEAYGDCLLCGGENKLYINQETSLWSCKRCGEEGNLTSFLAKYYKVCQKEYPVKGKLVNDLAKHRSLPASILRASGLFYDGSRYGFPVRNQKGNIVNFRRFTLKRELKVMGLVTIDNYLWGMEGVIKGVTKRVFVTEGEWDRLAFWQFLIEQGFAEKLESKEWAVVAVPGSGVWKSDWYKWFEGMHLTLIYDNDGPGERGLARTWELVGGKSRKGKLDYVDWPSELPEGFDFRDFYKSEGDWDVFQEMLSTELNVQPAGKGIHLEDKEKRHYEGDRPSLEEVLITFRKWLRMTPEHEMTLRVILAVVLSNPLKGDPLWVQIVAAPGSGKTELIMSTVLVENVLARSSISAKSLISGQAAANDPSLLPQLYGKTFVLKDFTEVLQMPRTDRDQVYSILRGAYDGVVERSYGNGMLREYRGYFSMIAGVTQAVDADNDSSMGDRFLKFRMEAHSRKTRQEVILESLQNVGKESDMKDDLQDVVARFLSLELKEEDVPGLPIEILQRIVALAEIVSMLRATVPRDRYQRDRIEYRPPREVGTRIAKQLKRLLIGLCFQHEQFATEEADFIVMAKVALDTCIPFNLEVVKWLIKNPDQQVDEIAKGLRFPLTTLRECMDNMELLGVLKKKRLQEGRALAGRRPFLWSVSKELRRFWEQAGLG